MTITLRAALEQLITKETGTTEATAANIVERIFKILNGDQT